MREQMSINLLSLATQALGGNFGKLASQFLGESSGATQKGLDAILPAIIGGLAQKGSTSDGAAGLLSLLNGPSVNSDLLSNVAGLFGNGGAQASGLLGTGASLLGSLFGDKAGGLASAVSNVAGLKSSSAINLLGIVAPLVFGMLRKHSADNSLNAGGLRDLLNGQSAHLKGLTNPSIVSALGWPAPSTAASAVASSATRTAAAATAVAANGSSSLMKFLPWLIAAAVAIWFVTGMKGCGSEKIVAPTVPAVAPVAQPAPMPAPAVVATPAPVAAPSVKPEAVKFYFDSAKYDPPAEAAKMVDKLVDYSRTSPNTKIGISGFHDKQGDPAKNVELAKQRALAIKNVLISAGVPEDRLIMNKPTELADTKDDKEARRVDVFVSQ
jgi:outer membrane protein OmpA-like peptidoglycan-associated protein